MTEKSTQPFTYVLHWSEPNLWYYGSKYQIGCQPSDLWTKYFSSSAEVKKARNQYGQPDRIEVRQLFDTAEDTLEWEARFLTKVKALQNPRWINGNIGGKKFKTPFGHVVSEETRKKQGISRKKYWNSLTEEKKKELTAKSGTRTIDGLRKMKQKAIERFADKEWMEKVYKPAHNKPEYLKALSERSKFAMNDPVKSKKHREALAKPEYKAKITNANLKRWARVTPEQREAFRKKCSEAAKRRHENNT